MRWKHQVDRTGRPLQLAPDEVRFNPSQVLESVRAAQLEVSGIRAVLAQVPHVGRPIVTLRPPDEKPAAAEPRDGMSASRSRAADGTIFYGSGERRDRAPGGTVIRYGDGR
jgi:hypothetical protein